MNLPEKTDTFHLHMTWYVTAPRPGFLCVQLTSSTAPMILLSQLDFEDRTLLPVFCSFLLVPRSAVATQLKIYGRFRLPATNIIDVMVAL